MGCPAYKNGNTLQPEHKSGGILPDSEKKLEQKPGEEIMMPVFTLIPSSDRQSEVARPSP
jgi:hypothetical protein